MSLNDLFGFVVIAIIALFFLFGMLKGFLRILVGFLFSPLMLFVYAGVVGAFVVPGLVGGEDALFGGKLDLSTLITNALGDNLSKFSFLTKELFMTWTAIDIVAILGYTVALYIAFRLLGALIEATILRIMREYKSHLLDMILGGAVFAVIGVVVAAILIIAIQNIPANFWTNVGFEQMNTEITGDGAQGMYTKIIEFIKGFNLGIPGIN